MSEKRFYVEKMDDDFCIFDSFNDDNVVVYCRIERVIQECCDLLNELSDENGRLKEENKRLESKLKNCEHEHFLDSLGGSNTFFGMGGF